MSQTSETHVYKLLTGADWQAASTVGVTCAEVDEKDFADLIQRLEERGKANLEVDVFIPNADAPALVYKARYHCRPN